MTLEKLVQIVVEIVEKTAVLQKLQVGVCIFDKANTEHACEYAKIINGEYRIFEPENTAWKEVCEPCDILFVDCLPAHCLAKLALCVCDDQLLSYINKTVLQGGAVFVLTCEDSSHKKTPTAYTELLKKYIKMLKLYGYVFLNSQETISEIIGVTGASKSYPGKKVLTKADLLYPASNSVVAVDSSVLITDLAWETARYRNIEIVRI